jgi:hypothetical protein
MCSGVLCHKYAADSGKNGAASGINGATIGINGAAGVATCGGLGELLGHSRADKLVLSVEDDHVEAKEATNLRNR